jgi:outer membrane murein-binding lipoprotein Lpp
LKQKKVNIGVIAICLMLALAGCSSNQTTDSQSSEEVTVLGEVSAISEDSLTLAEGTEQTMDESQIPSDEESGGTPPDGTTESGSTPDSGEMPSGDMPDESGDKPSGDMQGGGEMPSMLDLTGEEITVSIDENTVITQGSSEESTEASISDISEGTVVSVTYDKSSMTATSITIKSMGFSGGGGGKGAVRCQKVLLKAPRPTKLKQQMFKLI